MPPLQDFQNNRPPIESFLGQPPQEPGFFPGVQRAVERRGEQFAESRQRQEEGIQTAPETGFQLAGQTVGLVGDVVFEGLAAVTPRFIKDAVKSGVEKIANIDTVRDAIESYTDWKKKNPRSASNLESAVNVGSVIPVTKGVSVGTQKALQLTGRESGRLASFFEMKLSKQQLDDAVRVVKPELTKKGKVEALSKGDVKKGITGAIKTLPTDRDLDVAEAVTKIVSSRNNPATNIANIQREISRIGQKVDDDLLKSNAIFNTKQLRSQLNTAKDKSRVVFGSDRSLSNQYNAVVDEFVRIIDELPKTVSGLRQARIKFDGIMKEKFPNAFNNPLTTDVVRYNAINDVRRAANRYTNELLPKDSIHKESLQQMNRMFDAVDNIAQKTANVVDVSNTKRVLKALRQNPLVAGVTGGILTFGALTGLLTNPLILGGLLLTGTAVVGKRTITSQSLKQALIAVLRQGEKLAPAERQAVRKLLTEIDSFEHIRSNP